MRIILYLGKGGVGKTSLSTATALTLADAGKKVLYARCMECPEDKQPGAKGCGAYDRFEVQLGGRYGDDVHVVEGLEAGSEVVVAGQYQLKTALGSGTLEAGCGGH